MKLAFGLIANHQLCFFIFSLIQKKDIAQILDYILKELTVEYSLICLYDLAVHRKIKLYKKSSML